MSSSIDIIDAGELGPEGPDLDILGKYDGHRLIGSLEAVVVCSLALSFVARIRDCSRWRQRVVKIQGVASESLEGL